MADVTQKRYVVTAHTKEGCERLYNEIESADVIPEGTTISRSVMCDERRPSSRSTVYFLTNKEAVSLKYHPDVKSVQPVPVDMGISVDSHETTQTSNFSRSSTQNSNHKNWGLLRSVEGGVNGDWSGDNTQTITLTETGRNVDCVIMDSDGQVPLHPEFAVNADGTGGSRVNLIDWYTLYNGAVGGQVAGSYNYGLYPSGDYHAIHVMGTVGGNTQGWARNANLYQLFYYAGDISNTNFPYVYEYVKEFHRTKAVNPDTGVKNPTVVNSSWGMSIFPSDWSFDDITAVTYRGTRYTPSGAVTEASGFSGIYTSISTSHLALFTQSPGAGDNDSYLQFNCATTGTDNPGTNTEGSLNPVPTGDSWVVSNSTVANLQVQTRLASEQVISIQTLPAGGSRYGDFTVDFDLSVSYATPSGTCEVEVELELYAPGAGTAYATYTSGVITGTSITATIDESMTVNQNGTWTAKIITTYNVEPNPNCTYDCSMSATLNVTDTSTAGATATLTASGNGNVAIDSVAGLNLSTTPAYGTNDDGYWTLTLPFNITVFSQSYNQINIGTNSYITFGGGSSIEPTAPQQVNRSKIMIGSGNKDGSAALADTSGQRIYYGTTPTGNYSTAVVTHSVTAVNNSNVAYTLSGTDRIGAVSGDSATINMLEGDTIELTNNSNFVHPIYIKIAQVSGTGSQVVGATGQGAYGGTTVTWTPTNAGTYYYQCSSHSGMNGQIIVSSNASTDYYRIVFEGTANNTGILGSPNIRWEVRFDEDNPTNFRVTTEQIDQVEQVGGTGFTTAQLNDYGFIAGKRITVPVDALDNDIVDALEEGVHNVSSAGNGQWYHAAPGDQDWDNTFEMGVRYPSSVSFPYYYMRGSSPGRYDTLDIRSADPEYNNGAVGNVTGNGSDFFKREATVNGVRVMAAGAVGGQTAVPDAWIEKVARMFELFTDPNGTGINEEDQRNLIKTLSGDTGTYHAGAPTIQRVARGAGSDYSTNFLTDAGIIFWDLTDLFDNTVQNDMVWYLNSTGDGYGDGDIDAQEVIEHVFHTLHMHGLPADDIKLYQFLASDWQTGDLYAAMEEAYDASKWDPSGYQENSDDWKTDSDAFEVAAKEYLYLLNFAMFEYTELWDGGSLAPEWTDDMRTQAGIQSNNPLGYAFHNTYIAPVISKPSLATIRSIFQDGNTPAQDNPALAGASGYVVTSVGSSLGQYALDGTIVVGAFGNYTFLDEKPADYSDRGPGITLWAPGTYIQSSYSSASSYGDPRNSTYKLGKISGTSMASPQVAGVLACLLETYPEMTPLEAKNLLVSLASKDDILDSGTSNYEDNQALLGSPNLLLRYVQQRKAVGTAFPKRNFKQRPTSGVAYPRTRIRR